MMFPDIKRMIKELTEPKLSLERCATCTDGKFSEVTLHLCDPKRLAKLYSGMNKDEELHAHLHWICPGSISNDTAKEMLSETYGIMQQYDSYKITVLCFDTGIYNVETFSVRMARTSESMK